MTQEMYHFNNNIYFMAMMFDVPHISIKIIIIWCIPKPVFLLPFLLFLTLQLEPPKSYISWDADPLYRNPLPAGLRWRHTSMT